jgi:SAM-dependent methyltransferase
MNAYDQVLYVNKAYPQTHPSRMAAIARLHGVDAPAVETARVLELGASEGGNLLPMAATLPQAQFTGIDLAGVPVERGNRAIRDLGLSNVRLIQMDLLEVDAALGQFDYVIAHGLYAWTPPEVRDKILAIARANLSPHGVAFVSYNANPAGYVRRILREMMLFRIGDAVEPGARLERARRALEMLAARRPKLSGVDAGIAGEAEEALKLPDSALYHDYLAPAYEPAYVAEFAAHAAGHGLAYLADAEGVDERRYHLEPALLEEIRRLAGGNRVVLEQYLDLVRLRRFRQTLVCRADVAVLDTAAPERAVGLYAATRARETAEGKFEIPGLASAQTAHPEVLAFLRGLAELWPCAARVEQRCAAVTLESWRAGVVELRATPGTARRPGATPQASPVARYQARCGQSEATTLDHRTVALENDAARRFLQLLDGSRDRDALAQAMPCGREEVDRRLEALGSLGLLLG